MSNSTPALDRLERGLIAILRGIKPEETEAIVAGLVDAGISAIEIPLNSPSPFHSIEIARKCAPEHCMIGAGTVLTTEDVVRLHDVGGQLVVSPNVDGSVIAKTKELGMTSMPGVFSPTEALSALSCGADALKFFPANLLGPSGIAAIRAVLPSDVRIGAVGGIGNKDFAAYMTAGIHMFGIGSSLYKPGHAAKQVVQCAVDCVAAYDAAHNATKAEKAHV